MKAGRVRCGRCDRVLLDPRERKQKHHRKMERNLSERDTTAPWTHEDILAAHELATRPRRENGVPNRVVTHEGRPYLLVTCPTCHSDYAAADFRARWTEARARNEDLLLLDSDLDRLRLRVSHRDTSVN